jgi:hypothetical protein
LRYISRISSLENARSMRLASTTSHSLRRIVFSRDRYSGKTLRASCMVTVLNPCR